MGIKLYGTQPSPSLALRPPHAGVQGTRPRGRFWLLSGPAPRPAGGLVGSVAGTVPAIKIDGPKASTVPGDLAGRSRRSGPSPAALPRRSRAAALRSRRPERWGDEVLQDIPRRIVRWLSVHRPETREMIARRDRSSTAQVRRPGSTRPSRARYMAKQGETATREIRKRGVGAGSRGRSNHADELIAAGGDRPARRPNARGLSDRHFGGGRLLTLQDLRPGPGKGARPRSGLCGSWPEFGNDFPAGLLPPELLGAPQRRQVARVYGASTILSASRFVVDAGRRRAPRRASCGG